MGSIFLMVHLEVDPEIGRSKKQYNLIKYLLIHRWFW